MKIKIFILTTGQYIMTEILPSGKFSYPCYLTRPKPGEINLHLMIIEGDPSEVDAINGRHVILPYVPDQSVIDFYLESVTKFKAQRLGITIPPQNNKVVTLH